MKRFYVCILGIGCSFAASACSSDGASPFTGSGGGDPVGHAGTGGSTSGGGSGGARPSGSGGGDPLGNGGVGGHVAGSGGASGGSAGANVGGTSSGGSGGSGGSAPNTRCGQLSGNWLCDQGVIHRATAGTCEIHLPPDVGPSGSDDDDCVKNSDCTKSANGYCATESGFRGAKNYCLYACITDAECGAGYACLCGAIGGECVSAICKTDAECSGRYCAGYSPAPSLPGIGFACQSAKDECESDADCHAKSPMNPFCGFSGDHRVCTMPVVAEPGVN